MNFISILTVIIIYNSPLTSTNYPQLTMSLDDLFGGLATLRFPVPVRYFFHLFFLSTLNIVVMSFNFGSIMQQTDAIYFWYFDAVS